MSFDMDPRRVVGTIAVCLIVAISRFTVHAEDSSTKEGQVKGYLSELSKLTCPHNVPRNRLTEMAWFAWNDTDIIYAVATMLYNTSKQVIQLKEFQGRVEMTYNTLEISPTKLSDGMHYKCRPSESHRPLEIWWSFKLTVYVHPENIALLSVDSRQAEGTQVKFKCSVQLVKPRPKIFWRIGDTGVMHNGSRSDNVTKHQNGTFSIQSWYELQQRREDDGKFLYCVVTLDSNSEDVLGSEKIRLSVHYKPYGQAEIRPRMLEMAEGTTETLYCSPPKSKPTSSWFGWKMQNGTFVENTTLPELKLSPAYVNESHFYQCFAGNYLGQSNGSDWANVTVLDAAIIKSREGALVRGSGIVATVVGVVLGIVLIICIIAVGLVIWRHKRKSDGMYRSGGTKSAMISMESMPLQYRSTVSDVIRSHPEGTPPPKKPPRIYSYEHPEVYKKYFDGLPTPPPSPHESQHHCDNNKNINATTQEEDKAPEEIVYAELKHASLGQKDFVPPKPRQKTIYADLEFSNKTALQTDNNN